MSRTTIAGFRALSHSVDRAREVLVIASALALILAGEFLPL